MCPYTSFGNTRDDQPPPGRGGHPGGQPVAAAVLNKPFTIDDPLFLREAKHALVDPLHPADFEQVWNAGDRLKLSQYLLGGTLPAYVLVPVAALGGREWMAHLYQLLLLCGFLIASLSVARLGCYRRQANPSDC